MSLENKEVSKTEPVAKSSRRRNRENGFEEWGGYMAAKKLKLSAQFDVDKQNETENQDESQTEIFKGVSIYVNGYTKPSAEHLKRMMMMHGGRYHYYYSTTKTTHIVASNLPHSKIKKLKNEIVVKPDWIVDSIEAGKLLPYQDYLLYTPEFTHGQHRLKFKTDSRNAPSTNIMTETSNTVYNSDNSSDFPEQNGTLNEEADELNKTFSHDVIMTVKTSFSSSANAVASSSKREGPVVAGQPDNCSNFPEQNGTLNEEANELNQTFSHSGTDNTSFASSANAETFVAASSSKREGPAVAGQPGFLSEFYNHSRLHHISTAGQELKRYVQTLVDNHDSKHFSGRDRIKELIQSKSVLLENEEDCKAMKNDGNKKTQRVVMHLDMDCFFVSVGLRKHPELRGKPVAVTHSKGIRGGAQEGSDINFETSYYRNQSKKKLEGLTSVLDDNDNDNEESDELDDEKPKEPQKIPKYSKDYGSLSEIASCSYEARACGVRNGMFLGEALRRCPSLKTIQYDFEGYSEVSKKLYDIVASYTLDIEAISCDELFVDCTDILQDTGLSPLQFASVLRSEIAQVTGCTASAGLGPNMLIARLANRVAKPNGQHFVSTEMIEEFMINQKVKDLPGVGYRTSSKFESLGIITCGDLQKWNLAKLQQEYGPKTGLTLYNRCRGKDDRVVQLSKERKSVSAEINYGIRFEKEEDIYNFLKELSVEVAGRLRNIACKGKSVTLKLMVRHPEAPVQTAKFMGHGVCEHITKSSLLKSATDDPVLISNECCMIAKGLKIKPEDYRGVGIQLSKLESFQKNTKGHKSIETFLSPVSACNDSEGETNKHGIFAPKPLISAKRTLPKGSTLDHFLSNKTMNARPSPIEEQIQNSSSNEEGVDSESVKKIVRQLKYEKNAMVLNASSVSIESTLELDQSVLDALPEDLKQEVLEAYCKKLPKRPDNMPSSSTASSFSSKCSKDVSKKNKISSHSKISKGSAKQKTLINCFQSNEQQSKNTDGAVSRKKNASIAGVEDINEVKNLLEEWVSSSQDVLDEDRDQFRDYILEVIDEDLKKVDIIMKHFYGIVSTANSVWQQPYLTVLSYIQQKTLQKFGKMLDAKIEFET